MAQELQGVTGKNKQDITQGKHNSKAQMFICGFKRGRRSGAKSSYRIEEKDKTKSKDTGSL